MASFAGARRTESSLPAYYASTNPSTVGILSRYLDPALGLKTGYDASLAARLAAMPLVQRSATSIIFDANIDIPSIKGIRLSFGGGGSPPEFLGSPDGEFQSIDRITVVAGRPADPASLVEAVMNAQAAREMGVRVGSVIRIPMYTDAQVLSPNASKPSRNVTVRLVGEFVAPRDVLESDIDALKSASVIFSPALTRTLMRDYSTGTTTLLQLKGGSSAATRVLADAYRIDPTAAAFPAEVTASFIPVAQNAITPEATALGVFAALAMLSALIIAGLMISRMLRNESEDLRVLRALGADRRMLLGDQLFGVLGAIVFGSILAIGVAVALSPLAPLGPVRSVYPFGGIAVDTTALGLGLAVLVAVLGTLAVAIAQRETVSSGHTSIAQRRETQWFRLVASSRLPLAAQLGVRFATDPGRGRSAAPVRSAMVGAVLATTVVVAAVTFGTSLNSLVAHPPLYGWNWNYALFSGFSGAEDLPGPQIASLLNHDRIVQAWSGVNFVKFTLDGQRIDAIAENPGAAVEPPVLTGHGLMAANQIVLGAETLALLHKKLGDTVLLGLRHASPKLLRIVGVVTMPALAGGAGAGTGAIVATAIMPSQLLNLQSSSIPGPNAVLIRIRAGVPSNAALLSLNRVNQEVNALPASQGTGDGVVSVLRPIEIVNFRSMGQTPLILAGSLAAEAIIALGLTLAASVRRRRRDLALLKSLGFTRRQLAASISWQATVAALVGVVAGFPLGVVIGRQVWLLFARKINVVPVAVVPLVTLLLIGLGAIVFANLVAALPGRYAARTPAAIVLRSE